MISGSVTTSCTVPSQAIYLYTAPLHNDYCVNGRLKKTIGIIAHWAVCIQGVCYEVRRADKSKGERDHLYQSIPEQEWIKKRNPRQERKHVGYMAMPFEPWLIDYVASLVWEKTLKGKYIVDESNCQAFARYLVELIGCPATKAEFPQFFDKWVKSFGTTRDVAFLGILGGAALIGVGAVTAGVDAGSTAAAGFAVAGSATASSVAAMFAMRNSKEKHIKKAQEEIREAVRLKYGIELP